MKTQQTPLTMVLSGRHGGEVSFVVAVVLQPRAVQLRASNFRLIVSLFLYKAT
jgi:hypothetical protein